MATETGPDLSAAAEAVEDLMDDTCVVWRHPDAQKVLDPATNIMVATPNGQPSKIYEGKCAFRRTDDQDIDGVVVSLPISSESLLPEDQITITSSRRQVWHPDMRCQVLKMLTSTMAIKKAYRTVRIDSKRGEG